MLHVERARLFMQKEKGVCATEAFQANGDGKNNGGGPFDTYPQKIAAAKDTGDASCPACPACPSDGGGGSKDCPVCDDTNSESSQSNSETTTVCTKKECQTAFDATDFASSSANAGILGGT